MMRVTCSPLFLLFDSSPDALDQPLLVPFSPRFYTGLGVHPFALEVLFRCVPPTVPAIQTKHHSKLERVASCRQNGHEHHGSPVDTILYLLLASHGRRRDLNWPFGTYPLQNRALELPPAVQRLTALGVLVARRLRRREPARPAVPVLQPAPEERERDERPRSTAASQQTSRASDGPTSMGSKPAAFMVFAGAQALLHATGHCEQVMYLGGRRPDASSIFKYITAINSRCTLRSTLRSFRTDELTQVFAQVMATDNQWTAAAARDVSARVLQQDGGVDRERVAKIGAQHVKKLRSITCQSVFVLRQGADEVHGSLDDDLENE